MLTAIVGINWGDEGKGRMVDLLSEKYNIVVRYQGGNNAGHTVINEKGKFILNLLPSGILRENVINVMGPGMVIDLEHLGGEIEKLQDAGITVSSENLKISDRATICMPYHIWQDALEEDRLGDAKFGSTRRGIAYVYGDKYMKKALRMSDLLFPEILKEKLVDIVKWKNLTICEGYKAHTVIAREMYDWLMKFGEKILHNITDVNEFLNDAATEGKHIMFEAQLGALRDIDYGIYPYTSSSSTLAAFAPIGGGLPGKKLTDTVGIMKAYSSCVGEGPFVCEMFGEQADELREAGGEYGAATGRPRRVGSFDAVASRYGTQVQGADYIALTKLDVLSYLEQIPVCVQYEINGMRTNRFPVVEELDIAKPVINYVVGWHKDISHCRKKTDLPLTARHYIEYIEKCVKCPIKYVSVGPERDAYIEL